MRSIHLSMLYKDYKEVEAEAEIWGCISHKGSGLSNTYILEESINIATKTL